jgi:hypothetical protein
LLCIYRCEIATTIKQNTPITSTSDIYSMDLCEYHYEYRVLFCRPRATGVVPTHLVGHLSDMSSMAERFEIPFFEPSENPTIASKTCPWSPLYICAQPLYVQFLFVFTRLFAIRPFLCMLSHCILLSGVFDSWHGTFRAAVRHGTVLTSHSYAGYYAPTGPAS